MNPITGVRTIAERILPSLPNQTLRTLPTPFSRSAQWFYCRTLTSLSTPSENSSTLSGDGSLKSPLGHISSQLPSISPIEPPSKSSPTSVPTHIEPYIDASISTLLPLLRAQSSYYAQVFIQGHPYLITAGDSVRLPFVMQNVQLGDIIRLNRATVFGSRDYTLKAPATARGEKQNFLDERLFVARATIVNVVYEPSRVKIRKYPRNRHARHLFSKHSYTILKISELRPASEEELKAIQTENHNKIESNSS